MPRSLLATPTPGPPPEVPLLAVPLVDLEQDWDASRQRLVQATRHDLVPGRTGSAPDFSPASPAFPRALSSPLGVSRTYSAQGYSVDPPTAATSFVASLVPLRGTFTMRGQLFHAFVSYRVATEGPAGNGLANRVAKKIQSISMDVKELHLPPTGWGIWPVGAKRPVPYRKEEAKVFLDKDCLLDGQNWVTGFIQGLVASMTFVPLLSWTEDDQGSVGALSRIGIDGFDRVDNLLLELILATALREEPGAACQAILPVIVGPLRSQITPGSAAEGGGFGPFPFYKLARLSDAPSEMTNEVAAAILRQLGLGEEKVDAVLRLSVKQVVDSVLRSQGVHASSFRDVEEVVTECGTRVLKTVLQETRRLRSDPKYFEQGRPMGSEVLEWLQEENLRSFAPLFVHHRLDSLDSVARLEKVQLSKLFDEHEELFPRSGQKGAMGGELAKLEKDERTLLISERLERYRDQEASEMAVLTSGNSLELVHTKRVLRWLYIAFWLLWAASWSFSHASSSEVWGSVEISLRLVTVVSVLCAGLPLACSTGRSFAAACPRAFSILVIALLFSMITLGLFGAAATWGPLFCVQAITMRYRQQYTIMGYSAAMLVGVSLSTLLDCTFDHNRLDGTYAECVALQLETYRLVLVIDVCSAVGIVGRNVASDFLKRRAARESRELHRVLWLAELSKVAATPEVTKGLCRIASGIERVLLEQRRLALRSLGVVARVMAFLEQRAGRWSLRGFQCKARQAHGDIDLLFDEAAMVNEPFLDMIVSLVSGIGSTHGQGGDRTSQRSVSRVGSTESSVMRAGSTESCESSKTTLALKRGPIKKPARALQKLVRLYGRDVAMLTDLVEVLMSTLAARSVVGLAGAEERGEGGGEADPMLDTSDREATFRITAIKNRFDESYDDSKTGGYRDLSLNVEVGWVMEEGLVCFKQVRDWGRLDCQRHICEIQVRLRSQHHQIVTDGLHTRYVKLRNKSNT